MENNRILIGTIGAILIFISAEISKIRRFSRKEKIILIILVCLFFPLGIISTLVLFNLRRNDPRVINLKKKEELKILKEKGFLTEEEFENKMSELSRKNSKDNFEKSEEFKTLKKALKSGLITEQEFSEKINQISPTRIEGITFSSKGIKKY